jgi:hypothetical protein
MMNCTFIGNSATFGGAVIGWVDAEPTILSCVFIDNSAWFGGAIESADRAVVTAQSCTFWRNAGERGGAVMSEESAEVFLRECTFCENEANIGGAGLACEVDGHAFLENTIIAFSTMGEAALLSPSSTATFSCCDLYGNAGGDWIGPIAGQYGIEGNISADPLFCNLEEGNFRLHPNSPCAPFSPPNPECNLIGAWPVGCDPQSVGRHPKSSGIFLLPGTPNPFVGHTRVRFGAEAGRPDQSSSLRIFDQAGRLVRRLVEGPGGAQIGDVLWDGTDDRGIALPGGIYLVRFRVGGESLTRRVTLVR